MAKRINKSIPVPTTPVTPKMNTWAGIIKILAYVLYLSFWFSSEICIRPLAWLMAMVIRAGIAYEFSLHSERFFLYFTPTQETTAKSLLFDLGICLPLMIFVLWWCCTSGLMFLGALYGQFGQRSSEAGEHSEFKKLADYTNNRMRFQSYRDSLNMLTGKDKK